VPYRLWIKLKSAVMPMAHAAKIARIPPRAIATATMYRVERRAAHHRKSEKYDPTRTDAAPRKPTLSGPIFDNPIQSIQAATRPSVPQACGVTNDQTRPGGFLRKFPWEASNLAPDRRLRRSV